MISLAVQAALGLLAAPGTPTLSGLLQAELVRAADSEDQLADGTGAPLNRDRFAMRRARLRLEGDAAPAAYVAEASFDTVDAPRAGVRQVEVAAVYRSAESAPVAVTARLGAGVFAIPFGHEVGLERDGERLFAERSAVADALFPGQLDAGARLVVAVEGARLELAVQNGEPIAAASFPGRDPNAAKDFTGRAGYVATFGEQVEVEVGVSALSGTGFHAGTSPTKEVLVWRDFNEDGLAQASEISAIPGSAGTPSEDFDRWATGADARVQVALPVVGELTLAAEAVVASNLDRAGRRADPVLLGRDQRAIGYVAALTQALGEHALVGARLDVYRSELDRTELRSGRLVRAEETRRTWTVAAAGRLSHPHGELRLLLQYSMQEDTLGRDDAGRPADLDDDRITARLQVTF